jgi:TonB family protein
MKASLLLFAAAGALTFAANAQAANREVDAYLQRAADTATAQIAAAGVETPSLKIRARVDSDGRLTGARVVGSTGSLDTDQKATRALKGLRVASPPLALIGAEVNLTVGPPPILQAKVP